jgi:hypothetical protein
MRAQAHAPSRLVVIAQAAVAATAGVVALGAVVAISPEGMAAFPITRLWSDPDVATAAPPSRDVIDLATEEPGRLFPLPPGPSTSPTPDEDRPDDEDADEQPDPESVPVSDVTPTDIPGVLPTLDPPPAEDPAEPGQPAQEPDTPTAGPTPTTPPVQRPTTPPRSTPKPPTTTPKPRPTPSKPTPDPTATCSPSNPGQGRGHLPGKGKATGRPDYTGDGGVGRNCKGVGPTDRR